MIGTILGWALVAVLCGAAAVLYSKMAKAERRNRVLCNRADMVFDKVDRQYPQLSGRPSARLRALAGGQR